MSGYTKLFNSILASTVWNEPNETRIVWITMLAMADKRGVIEGSVPGLAVFARLPVEDTRIALERLLAPDEDSRSKEHDGRRICVTDGGWQILNHAKYRAKLGADERRDYNRVKQAQHREKKRQQVSLTVIDSTQSKHIAEAEAEATPKADLSNLKDLANTKVLAAATVVLGVNGHTPVNSRSKRPIFSGQRFVVFDWMLEDMGRILGPEQLNAFDVHEWFFELDARVLKTNITLSRAEVWPWLQSELVSESIRRGINIAAPTQTPRLGKQTQRLLAALSQLKDTL